MVLTPINQPTVVDAEIRKRQVQPIPMRRAAQPEEIAHVAVYLSSEMQYIHGVTAVVDGGLIFFHGQRA